MSWLIIAFSRIFVHRENKSVVRWGFQELLEMPFTSSPLLNEEHWKVHVYKVMKQIQLIGGRHFYFNFFMQGLPKHRYKQERIMRARFTRAGLGKEE